MAARNEVKTTIDGRVLILSNLDKVLFPDTGFTKGEVIDYYLRIAPVLLPHLADKVLTRIRFPDGVGHSPTEGGGRAGKGRTPSFYEKNTPPGCPAWITTQQVIGSDGTTDYLVCDQPATLIYLANLASLELHVPQWRIASAGVAPGEPLEFGREGAEPRAETVVIDLDPGEGLATSDLVRAAMLVGGQLTVDGLTPLVRSTGSKGFQVYAAIAPTPSREVARYAQWVASRLATAEPSLFVSTISVSARAGKVYLDYNQNLIARNTVAPYSLRGRERPSVSTPVTWDELATFTAPEDFAFSPEDVLTRIDTEGDLFADLLEVEGAPTPSKPPQ